MTRAQEVPDFPALFPEVFVKELREDMPPVRKILHRITLKDPRPDEAIEDTYLQSTASPHA